MADTLKIVVLDHQLDRMRECEQAVQQAVRELGLKADVTMVSEPPYLARMNVWDRLPALEINGMIWSLRPGEPFTGSEIARLLRKHFLDPDGQGQPPQP